jgi:hypothetical protein
MTSQALEEVMSRQPGWIWHALMYAKDLGNLVDEFWAYQPGATWTNLYESGTLDRHFRAR